MNNTSSKGKSMKYKKKRKNMTTKDVRVKRNFDDFEKYDSDRETNDPSWYSQYPELMKDSASLPYSIPTGTYVKWNASIDPSLPLLEDSASLQNNVYQAVPGIMTIGICPTPGISVDATSPVNVATKMLYTKVRAENSGSRNYDAPDLMLYCLAMDQIYSLITWYNRIYGTLMLYSQVNRYLPKAILDAQYVKFDDLINHINDFKAFLDTATAQAAVFSVPADMKLFNRHAFMYQNIYKDAESAKAQMYQFVPRVFYKYDEYNGAGRLVAVDLITTYPNGLAFSDLVALFYELMNPIIASEDFNIMSGDILKAFGEGNLIKLQIMPAGYTVFPIADYEVLTQMKNATMSALTNTMLLTIASDPSNWSIHQDANVEFIEYNPYLSISMPTRRYNVVNDRYLSTYKTTPEPADNMVASRLMYVVREEEVTSGGSTTYTTYFDSVGSEFVTGVHVTTFHYDANHVWTAITEMIHSLSETAIGTNATNFAKIMLMKHFDYCPAAYAFVQGSSNTFFYPIFDLDNWTIVHGYELEKMHRTAIMSMLRVPMIGSALPSNTTNLTK